jgi:hypothetical protein
MRAGKFRLCRQARLFLFSARFAECKIRPLRFNRLVGHKHFKQRHNKPHALACSIYVFFDKFEHCGKRRFVVGFDGVFKSTDDYLVVNRQTSALCSVATFIA